MKIKKNRGKKRGRFLKIVLLGLAVYIIGTVSVGFHLIAVNESQQKQIENLSESYEANMVAMKSNLETITAELDKMKLEMSAEAETKAQDVNLASVAIKHEDANYTGGVVALNSQQRDLVERVVQREFGDGGWDGAGLVAQAIRDSYLIDGYSDVNNVIKDFGYAAKSANKVPNQTVKEVVKYIFDEGAYIVKHPVMYFYAPSSVKSKFHESQEFVTEVSVNIGKKTYTHRYFMRKSPSVT